MENYVPKQQIHPCEPSPQSTRTLTEKKMKSEDESYIQVTSPNQEMSYFANGRMLSSVYLHEDLHIENKTSTPGLAHTNSYTPIQRSP